MIALEENDGRPHLITYCIPAGTRTWSRDEDGKWWVEDESSKKAMCGALVRVTSIGSLHNWQYLIVISVSGRVIGAHPKDLKYTHRTRHQAKVTT